MFAGSSGNDAGVKTGMLPDNKITLSSDGPDGVYGTSDDVTLVVTAPELVAALNSAAIPFD
jgi:protein-disulfide isomerase